MIYHVFANRSNIGDWLSARGIQKLLPALEIRECLCDQPFVPETIEALSHAKESDLIIIGGGGLLMDYFLPFWQAFEPIADRVPFCIWGIGYCDLKNEFTLPPHILIEKVISKSQFTLVRDELSRSYLPHCNLPDPVACPSLNLFEETEAQTKDILHVVNYTTAGADAYDIMRSQARAFSKKTGSIFRETNNRIEKDSAKELEQTLSLYSGSGIVLSSALHGCIIGLAMGRKVLAVSGDRKIDAFMEMVGLGEWVLNTGEAHKVEQKLMEIHRQEHPAKLLAANRKMNREAAGKISRFVKQATV